MIRFVTKAGLMAIAILAVTIVCSGQGWFPRPSFFLEIVIFLLICTIGIYAWTIRSTSSRRDNFVNIYLGSTALRILVYGVFIAAIISLDEKGAVGNAVMFLVTYVLYTLLEVIVLFLQVNSPRIPGQNND